MNHVLRAYVTICNTLVTIRITCCNIYKSSNVPLECIYGLHVTYQTANIFLNIINWSLQRKTDYTLITNLMHWLLFIHKIIFSSTCFEHQVLIFRRTQLYTSSIWYRHYASCVSTGNQDSYREWRYHMLLVYNYVLLKMSTWCSKHVEENSILWINNNQCIKLEKFLIARS